MESGELSIGELADRAGLSRRAIRFYVQQDLLPAPLGRGRGRHYDATHLERLKRIAQLQTAGHSLDAIRKILARQPGDGVEPAPMTTDAPRPSRPRPALSAELWTRLRLMEGVELHFDAAKFRPEVEGLLEIRDVIRSVFRPEQDGLRGGGNGSANK